MKKQILSVLALSCLTLNACIEVRDPENQASVEAPAPVPLQTLERKPDLLIDDEMYVYQNQILTMDQIERLTYKSAQNWTPSAVTQSYGKIEVTARGKLYTMGNDLKLIADEFISNRGQIETLPPGTKATLNAPGMDGGHLTLQVERAEGQLFVTMRGQEGGDGLAGADSPLHHEPRRGFCAVMLDERQLNGTPGNAGRKGGDTGSFHARGETKNLDIRVRREAGRGGQGGAGGKPGDCVKELGLSSPGSILWVTGQPGPVGLPGPDGMVLE